jgi:hypothetical protein
MYVSQLFGSIETHLKCCNLPWRNDLMKVDLAYFVIEMKRIVQL